MDDRQRLIDLIAETRLRLSDLTRELNESLGAEGTPEIGAQLELMRQRLLELERALDALPPS